MFHNSPDNNRISLDITLHSLSIELGRLEATDNLLDTRDEIILSDARDRLTRLLETKTKFFSDKYYD